MILFNRRKIYLQGAKLTVYASVTFDRKIITLTLLIVYYEGNNCHKNNNFATF